MDNSILSSECAFSCKMKLEVMKRQGFRTDLTSSQLGTKLQTQCIVAQGWGKIALTSAVGLSFLKKGGMGTAADIIFSDGKYGRNIAVERMKNLFAVLKKELKNKCFYLD